MTNHATGTFEVKLKPRTSDEQQLEGASLGRMTIDKQYEGDLAGTARGEMLTAMTTVRGSAGYVAMERVKGTLHGRRGSFVLQHSGTSTRGRQELVLTVVPDSGTDQLAGLRGQMSIDVVEGQHTYALEYTLEE